MPSFSSCIHSLFFCTQLFGSPSLLSCLLLCLGGCQLQKHHGQQTHIWHGPSCQKLNAKRLPLYNIIYYLFTTWLSTSYSLLQLGNDILTLNIDLTETRFQANCINLTTELETIFHVHLSTSI